MDNTSVSATTRARRTTRSLDWLDTRNAWQFLCLIYLARWVALIPLIVLEQIVFTGAQTKAASMPEEWRQGSPFGTFLGLVLIPPLLETLMECSLPYWLIGKLGGGRRSGRAWTFIVASAFIMAVFHPILAALIPAFITGAFLAYCYAHFAPSSISKAILATAGFHGAINLVGWIMLVFG